MEIIPKQGIGKFVFGMKPGDVAAVFGKADREYRDEDENQIALYYGQKIRLTFYKEEGDRLGYLICAQPDLALFGHTIIGRKCADVHRDLLAVGIQKWTRESYDTYENWFNEDNWMVLQTEFDEIVKFELGAHINDQDEFDWKFKS